MIILQLLSIQHNDNDVFVWFLFWHQQPTHTELQTLIKQVEIAAQRPDSVLQGGFVEDLKTLNLTDGTCGYVHKVSLQRDRGGKYLTLVNNVTLRKKVDPDVSTWSIAYILQSDDLQVNIRNIDLNLL